MRVACTLLATLACIGLARADEQDFARIERGRTLAVAADCMPCHTIPGGKPWAGGRTIVTPFGTLLSANITPDPVTGIGRWTDDQFVATLRQGIRADGAHIYPAMPYTYFTHMTDDDARSIRAYLATVTPVRNDVTSDQLPFPLSVRADMIAWNALFFTEGTYEPDAKKSATWNRGAYLVQALGHCGVCHTSKNFAGADDTDHTLQGGKLEGWYAPNLTADKRTGLGRWSAEDIVEYLQTGHNAMAAAAGPMSEVIEYSTSQMPKSDLHAIATYLKELPGQASGPSPLAGLATGRAIYTDGCAACHGGNGEGQARLFPSLASGSSVLQDDPASLVRVVLEGVRTVGTNGAPTAPGMPAFGWKLNDQQVAAVLTYVRNTWGNAAPAVDASAVASARKDLGEEH